MQAQELPVPISLGRELAERIEVLTRVREREERGDFDYAQGDLRKISNFRDFVDVCILRTPQNKGWLLEDFVCRKFGWKHLPPWKHCGDGYDLEGKRSYEIKSSFSSQGILLKQVRLFQKIDWYLYVKVNEADPGLTQVFLLDHDSMAREVKAHGRKSSKGRHRHGGNQYDVEIEGGTPEYASFVSHYSNRWLKERLLSS